MASHVSGSIVGPNFNYRHGCKRRGEFYLDTKKVIPPLDEVTGKVPSGLSDDLHANVVPRHPGNLAPIVHILLRLVQSVKVSNPAVAIVLAYKI